MTMLFVTLVDVGDVDLDQGPGDQLQGVHHRDATER